MTGYASTYRILMEAVVHSHAFSVQPAVQAELCQVQVKWTQGIPVASVKPADLPRQSTQLLRGGTQTAQVYYLSFFKRYEQNIWH